MLPKTVLNINKEEQICDALLAHSLNRFLNNISQFIGLILKNEHMKIHISRRTILDNILLKGMDLPCWIPSEMGGIFFQILMIEKCPLIIIPLKSPNVWKMYPF